MDAIYYLFPLILLVCVLIGILIFHRFIFQLRKKCDQDESIDFQYHLRCYSIQSKYNLLVDNGFSNWIDFCQLKASEVDSDSDKQLLELIVTFEKRRKMNFIVHRFFWMISADVYFFHYFRSVERKRACLDLESKETQAKIELKPFTCDSNHIYQLIHYSFEEQNGIVTPKISLNNNEFQSFRQRLQSTKNVRVIGAFGEPNYVERVLQEQLKLQLSSIQSLPLGLYASFLEPNDTPDFIQRILLFYHVGDQQKKQSEFRTSLARTNILYLSYLLKLCNFVYFCLDVDDLEKMTKASSKLKSQFVRFAKFEVVSITDTINYLSISPPLLINCAEELVLHLTPAASSISPMFLLTSSSNSKEAKIVQVIRSNNSKDVTPSSSNDNSTFNISYSSTKMTMQLEKVGSGKFIDCISLSKKNYLLIIYEKLIVIYNFVSQSPSTQFRIVDGNAISGTFDERSLILLLTLKSNKENTAQTTLTILKVSRDLNHIQMIQNIDSLREATCVSISNQQLACVTNSTKVSVVGISDLNSLPKYRQIYELTEKNMKIIRLLYLWREHWIVLIVEHLNSDGIRDSVHIRVVSTGEGSWISPFSNLLTDSKACLDRCFFTELSTDFASNSASPHNRKYQLIVPRISALSGVTFRWNVVPIQLSCHQEHYGIKNKNGQSADPIPLSDQSPLFEYLFQCFDKFPIQGTLQDETLPVRLQILIDHSENNSFSIISENATTYLKDIERRLLYNGKSPLLLRLSELAQVIEKVEIRQQEVGVEFQSSSDFLNRMISLVPIQVSRSEGNELILFKNGKPVINHIRNIDQLIQSISFGFFDEILDSWKGPVKVVSSMGKQSTGKSYLLNHLTGSLFAVSGGRCTDGCWMTLRQSKDTLYVVLDFEGLGSFERTEQEDMLLSVMNAAISDLTLFRTEFRFDKDTETMLHAFQSGASFIKQDQSSSSSLFTGKFFVLIKDVLGENDAQEVGDEFRSKIGAVLERNKESNFITSMYRGGFAIFPFPPLLSIAYYEQLHLIQRELVLVKPRWTNGSQFSKSMKKLIATMVLKGANITDSISSGNSVDIEDQQLAIQSILAQVKNFFMVGEPLPEHQQNSSSLLAYNPSFLFDADNALKTLRIKVKKVEKVRKSIDQRNSITSKWLEQKFSSNSKFFTPDVVRLIQSEQSTIYIELMNTWTVCTSKCNDCNLPCFLLKHHEKTRLHKLHSCETDHKCKEKCQVCLDSKKSIASICQFPSAHSGSHACVSSSHPCPQKCNACNMKCIGLFEVKHTEHKCNESWCSGICEVVGCKDKCAQPHLAKSHKHHCGKRHSCPSLCSDFGYCTADGNLLNCTIPLEPFQFSHGVHKHTLQENVVHFCANFCFCCQSYCSLEFKHSSEHKHKHN